jgi:hypothetical protein
MILLTIDPKSLSHENIYIYNLTVSVFCHILDAPASRVCHGYGNTCGVQAAGMAGTGTVWEIPTRSYTVPVTAVSRCHMGTIFACCHTVTQPNMGASRACILASYHPLLTPTPIPHQQTK